MFGVLVVAFIGVFWVLMCSGVQAVKGLAVPLFPFYYFLSFGACTLSRRFRYLWQAFPFWRSFGYRLLLLAVMVLFYPPEYKKAVAICQRLKV